MFDQMLGKVSPQNNFCVLWLKVQRYNYEFQLVALFWKIKFYNRNKRNRPHLLEPGYSYAQILLDIMVK